jgi:hypothetical protein
VIDPAVRETRLLISARLLRQFAALCLVIFGGLAALEVYRHGLTYRGIGLVALAAGLGIPGLVRPQMLTLVFMAAMAVATPIGWLVSHLLLGVAYYAVLTPLAAAFRLSGRDALMRRRRNVPSYWTPKERPADPDRYFRQT